MAVAVLLFCGCEKNGSSAQKERAPPRPLPGKSRPLPGKPVEYKKHPLYVILDTQPRNEYERELSRLMYKSLNPGALQQFCGQWFPSYGHENADAYMAWRKQNEATLKEIDERNVAVWNSYAGEDVAYVKMVQPHLRNQLIKSIGAEFDRSPTAKFDEICANFAKEIRSSKWNLEKRFKKELALVRRHPVTPAA
jgi:hypothetical protein